MIPFLSRSIGMGCLFTVTLASAQTQAVRVTTCDLAAIAEPGKPGTSIDDMAAKLKQLAPDVLILRNVSGWKMCSQLADALKPADYKVVACSAFRDSRGTLLKASQVAILSRHNAYFSWSEPWNTSSNAAASSGFIFAAIQVAGHRFGFSALELAGAQIAPDEAAQQWLKTLDAYRAWANNRLEGFVAGASGLNPNDNEISRALRGAGFENVATGPSLAVERAHLVPNADSPGGLLLAQWPLTCEFDFRPPPVVVVATPAPSPAPAVAALPATNQALTAPRTLWWLAAAGGFALAAILILQLGIRRRLKRLQAHAGMLPSGSYNVVLAPPALPAAQPMAAPETADDTRAFTNRERLRQGVLAHLAEWVKQAFIQRLVRDREHMAVTQQAATMKILAVDDRLARLEAKIQKETASYEKQIEQLSRELLTAREENLELIRAQITSLKSEMESARARVLQTEEN